MPPRTSVHRVAVARNPSCFFLWVHFSVGVCQSAFSLRERPSPDMKRLMAASKVAPIMRGGKMAAPLSAGPAFVRVSLGLPSGEVEATSPAIDFFFFPLLY